MVTGLRYGFGDREVAIMKPSGHERESDTEADVRLAAPGELGRPSGVGGRLLERGDELQRFVSAIALAKVGNGQVVTLEGSAGIGKTQLLRAAMELAAASGGAEVGAPRGSGGGGVALRGAW